MSGSNPKHVVPDADRGRRRGFTLTELLVAIAVVIGIMLAVSKIFSTVSTVSGVGEATTDVMQESAAIGRQLRTDLSGLAPDTPFMIRCVSVANNVNGAALLNPNLAPDARIRADQLVFFANGQHFVHNFLTGDRAFQRVQSSLARIYFGHAFQLRGASRPVDVTGAPRAFDVEPGEVVFPWTSGEVGAVRTTFPAGTTGGSNFFSTGSNTPVNILQPGAQNWLLVRQPVLLLDDDLNAPSDDSKVMYLREALSGRSIMIDDPQAGPSPQVRDGRVDVAASELGELRRRIQYFPNGNPRTWRTGTGGGTDQFSTIADQLMYYPRAERSAPSVHRIDQALTNHVIGTACSSVRIEWTYENGTGEVVDASGTFHPGVQTTFDTSGEPIEQQWFGHPDTGFGVRDYELHYGAGLGANAIPYQNIERKYDAGGAHMVEYVFGYNRTQPLDANGDLVPVSNGYTPLPSAIRITLTLHDPRTRLAGGREVQFILDLPRPTE